MSKNRNFSNDFNVSESGDKNELNKNNEENGMAFANTKIVCHGACAARIGERLLHRVWKYLRNTEFVKGNISENERKAMLHSISLKEFILYPDDIEKSSTECDIVYQIITNDDTHLEENLKRVTDKFNGTPCIAFVIGEKRDEIINIAHINLEEAEILDTFLDLFSIYTFPQEYGADFEEIRPMLEHKGEITTEKGEGFNLCVFRKTSKECTFDKEIKSMEQGKEKYILSSRMANEDTIKIYNVKKSNFI